MPSQKLTPTFCMEDMPGTMDMPDTMDTPMVDMPTLDKLFPLIKMDSQPSLFSSSVTSFSVLDIIFG